MPLVVWLVPGRCFGDASAPAGVGVFTINCRDRLVRSSGNYLEGTKHMKDQTTVPTDDPYRSDPAAAQAMLAQSDRMQGNTVSVRDRALQPGTFYAVGGRVSVVPQVRTRGTRRLGTGRPKAQSTRSSARSGDSGDDSSGESDEPPPRRRLCACCGGEIPADRGPRAEYIDDAHSARHRKRQQRERDRERAKRTAAVRIPKLDGRDPMHTLEPWVREQLHDLQVCRCNGKHLEFDRGSCLRCGRQLPATHPEGDIRVRSFIARLVREEEERQELAVAREHEQAVARLGAVAS